MDTPFEPSPPVSQSLPVVIGQLDQGVEQVWALGKESERLARDQAEEQRHGPGQGDEHDRAAAGAQRVLLEHFEAQLQFVEWSAVRSEELADFALTGSHDAVRICACRLVCSSG